MCPRNFTHVSARADTLIGLSKIIYIITVYVFCVYCISVYVYDWLVIGLLFVPWFPSTSTFLRYEKKGSVCKDGAFRSHIIISPTCTSGFLSLCVLCVCFVFVCVCVFVCMCKCVHVCVLVCVFACVYMYAYNYHARVLESYS